MCLGIPSKIIRIEDSRAMIDVYGAQREISLLLIEEPLKIGDYVLVHAGFAIQKLQEDVAKETLDLFDQYLDMVGEQERSLQEAADKPTKRSRRKVKAS
ncbi:MAG: HypC/HybG/HupF family hydrogenase formation chaperone [Nitrospirota bacterium]